MKLIISIGGSNDPYQDFRIQFMLNQGFELVSHSVGGTDGKLISEIIFQREIADSTTIQEVKKMKRINREELNNYIKKVKETKYYSS